MYVGWHFGTQKGDPTANVFGRPCTQKHTSAKTSQRTEVWTEHQEHFNNGAILLTKAYQTLLWATWHAHFDRTKQRTFETRTPFQSLLLRQPHIELGWIAGLGPYCFVQLCASNHHGFPSYPPFVITIRRYLPLPTIEGKSELVL